MKLLLDTHTLIWSMNNHPMLSQSAAAAITNLQNEGFVSVISIWEAAIRFRSGRLPEAAPLVHDPARILTALSFTVLPLQMNHARLAGLIASPCKDPSDRILAAQAILEGLTLVSRDDIFDTMPLTRLW